MAIYDVSTNEKKAAPSLVAGGTLYADSPIGTILPYGGASAPSGWFLCDGTAVSRTTYSELFAVIGTAFGSGDGSTTFNLPDMRESVPKGAGLTGHTVGAHVSASGLAVGEFLDDRLQEHQHKYWSTFNGTVANSYGTGNGSTPYTIDMTGRKGDTTEVKSVGVNYIIKAKMVAVPADFLSAVEQSVEDVYGDIIPSDASASNKLVTKSDLTSEDITDNCHLAEGVTGLVMRNGKIISVYLSYSGTIPSGFTWAFLPSPKTQINVTITGMNDSATEVYNRVGNAGVISFLTSGSLAHGYVPNRNYTNYFIQFTYITSD